MPANPDAPAAAYITAAIPPDSINHFVVLMTARPLRPVVAASIALTEVIRNIPRQGSEPQVRQLKLSWWLEEIEMIGRDKARHPLSIELARSVDHKTWLDPLHVLVRSALNDAGSETTRPVFRSLTELLPYCHRLAERQALIASVLPYGNDLAMSHARSVGVGICLTEVIRDRGFDPAAGQAGLQQLAAVADDHFKTAAVMSAKQRSAQSSVLLQAALYRRLLDRLRRHNYDPDKANPHPFTLLWQAWREARNLIT